MSLKTRQKALMHAISKKVKGLVDVKEHTTDNNCWCRHERHNEWIGRPTYYIRYEDCWNRGHYNAAEFLPDDDTQAEIDRAIAELTFQAEGLEFPEVEITK